MHYLSLEVRKLFDAAGLTAATIAVSNDLDETIIQALTDQGAPINSWGVGTQMVTGGSEAAFTGVYKLTAREDGQGTFLPVMKLSDNPEKTTNPGVKQVWRITDPQGMAVADVLGVDDPVNPDILEKGGQYVFWHTLGDYRHFDHVLEGTAEPLLKLRIEQGRLLNPGPALETIRGLVHAELGSFDPSYKRLLNPHVYKVSITERLRDLKQNLIKSFFHLRLSTPAAGTPAVGEVGTV
jgi:nicotinate phosphoribosyltransferase